MSDLRTRIAAVQQAHHLRIDPNHPAWGYCMCGYNPQSDDDDHWWVAHAKHVADAVVRELRLSDGVDLTYDHAYPRDYTDRQLWESVWRKIDGLAAMVAGPTRMYPDAHPDDIAEVVAAWTPTHNNEETP